MMHYFGFISKNAKRVDDPYQLYPPEEKIRDLYLWSEETVDFSNCEKLWILREYDEGGCSLNVRTFVEAAADKSEPIAKRENIIFWKLLFLL